MLRGCRRTSNSVHIPRILGPCVNNLRIVNWVSCLPLFRGLHNDHILIINNKRVTLHGSHLLTRTNTLLQMVTPRVRPRLHRLIANDNNRYLLHNCIRDSLSNYKLVVTTASSRPLGTRISTSTRQHYIPIGIISTPTLYDIVFPTVISHSPLVITVSDNNSTPILTHLVHTGVRA